MKRLSAHSQHFLRSPAIVGSLLRKTSISGDDVVYDLGAGSGVITTTLAPTVKHVVAVEIDDRLIPTLQRNCAPFTNITILHESALTMDLPRSPYKIVANIPFHISSLIVRRFVHSATAPAAAYLIVQKQFGQKLVSSQPDRFTSQLGMLLGAEYTVRILSKLEKRDFWPHPAVDTVFVGIERRETPLVERVAMPAYIRFTEECFANRAALAAMPLAAIGATAGLSPSRLTIDQWVALFKAQTKYR